MILEKINSPADLKKLTADEMTLLAEEVRGYMLDVISVNGGHLASSLGVVELTLALHHVFNTPEDKIIWDVGHQAYAHKIITGRREDFRAIRRKGGISGFPNAASPRTMPMTWATAAQAYHLRWARLWAVTSRVKTTRSWP